MALAELDQDFLRVAGIKAPGGFDGGGEESALLGHRPLLGFKEVALVCVEKQDPCHGQEYHEDVECQQSN